MQELYCFLPKPQDAFWLLLPFLGLCSHRENKPEPACCTMRTCRERKHPSSGHQDQPAPAGPSAGPGGEPAPTKISLALPGPEAPRCPTAFRATATANCFKSLILGGWLSSSSYLTQGIDHSAQLTTHWSLSPSEEQGMPCFHCLHLPARSLQGV